MYGGVNYASTYTPLCKIDQWQSPKRRDSRNGNKHIQSITRSIDNNFSTIDKNTFNITLTAGGSPGLVVVCDDSCF